MSGSKKRQVVLMIFLAMGTMIVLSNISAIALILPCFMDAFQADLITVQWLSNGYSASVCMTILVVGYISDRFSAKKTLLFGLFLMLFFSIASCFAQNIYLLIFLRLFIGLGAGLVLPTIPTIIYQSLDNSMQLTAMSINSVATGVGAAVGPVIAGVLEVIWGWKCLYFYTAILAAFLIIPLWKLTPEIYHMSKQKIDLKMLVLGGIGTFLLLFGCSYAGRWGWISLKTVLVIASGILSMILFICIQWKQSNPLLNVRTLKLKYFRAGCVMYALSGIALILSPTVMSFYFQRVWGYSALQASEAVIIPTIMMSVASLFAKKITDRFNTKYVILAMYIALVVIIYMLGQLTPAISFLYIFVWLCLRYIAVGVTDPLIGNCIYFSVPEELMGHASSVCNWLRQIIMALALAIFTAIIDSQLRIYTLMGQSYEISMCNALNDATIISAGVIVICIPAILKLKGNNET